MTAATATITQAIVGSVDSHARALAKAVSWRAVGTADTFLWGWLITGHAGHAGAIASLEVLTKIVLFYVHERAWRLIPWAPNARLRSLIKAISWRSADTPLGQKLLASDSAIHVVGRLKADDWNGRQGVQLEIEDAADPRQAG